MPWLSMHFFVVEVEGGDDAVSDDEVEEEWEVVRLIAARRVGIPNRYALTAPMG